MGKASGWPTCCFASRYGVAYVRILGIEELDVNTLLQLVETMVYAYRETLRTSECEKIEEEI